MDHWKSACISQGSTRETELVGDGYKENYCKEVAKAAVEAGWAGLKPTGWTTGRGILEVLGREGSHGARGTSSGKLQLCS